MTAIQRVSGAAERLMRPLRLMILLAQIASLAACATAQLHSETELNQVALACGLAVGDVVQEQEEKQLLFLYRIAPAAAQRHCVYEWAHKNHLNLVVINAVNDPSANEPHS